MRNIRLRRFDDTGINLNIDTSDQLSLRGAMTHPPEARRLAPQQPEPVAPQLDDLSILYSQPQFYQHAAPVKSEGRLSRMSRTFTIVRVLFFCAHLAISMPGMVAVGGSVCAALAVAAGYKLHKAPDSEAGKTVSTLAGARTTILKKGLDKIKEAADEPLEEAKEAAKHGVQKATAKVEEVKNKVEDAKEKAVEKVDEVKSAIIGMKATKDVPAQPGILEQATNKVAAIPAAITSNLPQGMTPDQVKAIQEKQKPSSSRGSSRYPRKTRAQIAMEDAQFENFRCGMGALFQQELNSYNQRVAAQQAEFFRRLRPN